jgi:hypothetical protein
MAAHRYVRRISATTLVLLALVAGGCGATASTPTVAKPTARAMLANFQNEFVALRYPAAWRPLVVPATGELHFDPMLYLSTQAGHDPCRHSGTTTACGWPVARLRQNGILIAVENKGYPGWSLATVPGKALRVGGRAAKKVVSRPGRCATIGADETIEVAIARPLNGNWTDVTACLRGPQLAARERELDALLATARFRAP